MVTVAVTGGIGSGKSEVCRYLEGQGVPVYDSDARTKMLYDTDLTLAEAVSAALGCRVTDAEGRIDRAALASVIFSDREKLDALEAVVHPRVLEDFLAWRDSHKDAEMVVMESAIFLQKPLFHPYFDEIILVDAPVETRILRACRRDGTDADRVRARIAAQMTDASMADYLIMNDSGLDDLYRKTDEVLRSIKDNKNRN